MSRVALVTGGSGGIGRSIADALRRSFDFVVLGDLQPPTGALDAAESFHPLDVRDEASVAACIGMAASKGELRALINCAGVIRGCSSFDMPTASVAEMLDINLLGAVRCTAAAVPHMPPGSAVVNISSISSRLPELADAVLYGASKSALETYTRASARALATRGIRVNAVAPGFIDVAMTEQMRNIAYAPGSPLLRVALRRMGSAGEVAACVEFLASERASYVVGSTLVVDGGLVIA